VWRAAPMAAPAGRAAGRWRASKLQRPDKREAAPHKAPHKCNFQTYVAVYSNHISDTDSGHLRGGCRTPAPKTSLPARRVAGQRASRNRLAMSNPSIKTVSPTPSRLRSALRGHPRGMCQTRKPRHASSHLA